MHALLRPVFSAALAGVLAMASAVPEESWTPAEITPGKRPVRVVILKTGWRGGPEALVLQQRASVRPLYEALAGNARLGFLCGYHWKFLFEYDGAPAESIDINEHCEVFRRDPKRTWRIVSNAFTKAEKHPTHFVALLHPEKNMSKPLRDAASRFGLVVPLTGEPELLAAPEPWTPARIQRVNQALQRLGRVEPVAVYDTGN